MSNLLQSSQVQKTEAPGYYTDYLSGLASKGAAAQAGAQYVGAQPLQQQAFQTIGQTAGQYQPMIGQGAGLVGQAGSQDIAGAAQPYISQAAGRGGLSSAQPYLDLAAQQSPAALAQEYMNPYTRSAVQSMSDIAQRNIQQNLSPAATAAAVGSGQFGSQRGAQVLGQIQSQAQQDLNSQIAQMLSSGYGQSLQAAGQRQQLLGQLGGTAGGLAQQQQALLGQLGGTAAQAAAQQAAAKQAAGLGMGALAQQGSGVNLANINALATLGGQQQTIAQNEQMFPLTSLSNLAGLLQGYQIPTQVTTELNMSPLSALAGSASMLGGLFTPTQVGGTAASPVFATPISQFGSAIGSGMDWLLGRFGASSSAPTGGTSTYNPYTGTSDEFSDIRLKKNIVKLSTRPDGLNVYEFDYIWGGPRQVGLMAHEVQDVYPDAVTERDGYLLVNYSKV